MRRRSPDQLVLDLGPGGKENPLTAVPEGLLEALAELLLEALGEQDKATSTVQEACDAAEDHT